MKEIASKEPPFKINDDNTCRVVHNALVLKHFTGKDINLLSGVNDPNKVGKVIGGLVNAGFLSREGDKFSLTLEIEKRINLLEELQNYEDYVRAMKILHSLPGGFE